MLFSAEVLHIDPLRTSDEIAETLRAQVFGALRKRGLVVGLSGGIDSSVVAALAVAAVGKERVLGVFMPERDSSPDSLRLGRMLAEKLGIDAVLEDISAALEGAGCYRRQESAIREVFPEYATGWKHKLSLPPLLEGDRLNVSSLVVEDPRGEQRRSRMPAGAYLALVAATSFKQRVRKMMEYYHADRKSYAVAGTPNRLEYDQGFFVKQGDGAADVKPIAHLYKTQVYALAEHLAVPEEIRRRPPTTDTYSLPQTQDEFYFALDYARMDLCLYGYNHRVAPLEVGRAIDLSEEQVARVYRDIEAKRRSTRHLHLPPLFVQPVAEV